MSAMHASSGSAARLTGDFFAMRAAGRSQYAAAEQLRQRVLSDAHGNGNADIEAAIASFAMYTSLALESLRAEVMGVGTIPLDAAHEFSRVDTELACDMPTVARGEVSA